MRIPGTTILFILSALCAGMMILFSGCNPVNRLARSKNVEDREKAARILMEKKEYEKASYLLEELIGLYRGTTKAEDILFLYSECKYELKDYLTSSFYYGEFISQFPNSGRAEEAQFRFAYCFYKDSDPWYLDQTSTRKAIEYFQYYLKTHSQSARIEEVEKLMRELRERLAQKAFEQANLYHKIGYHKAAVECFRQVFDEYPDTKYREEAQFKQFKSSILYANMSVEERQKTRYLEGVAYYNKFLDRYPKSSYAREAEDLFGKANSFLQKEYLSPSLQP
ncbi:MAG: outer membrane protein assembly factor BamD [Sphingobacteriia bacterium]|nr:outer membrane protein assembly factor BamD [Sphingobacteriia bacterium]